MPFELSRRDTVKGLAALASSSVLSRIPFASLNPTTGPSHNPQREMRFDGVYMNADVWINGHQLGHHPYGYTGFAYDITSLLRKGGENVVAVRVNNNGKNSRWYSGSGIYRHVWLAVTGSLYVPLWGVCVAATEVSQESAKLSASVRINNRDKTARDVTIRLRILDSNGSVAKSSEAEQEVPPDGEVGVQLAPIVDRPKLWSPATPHIYSAEIEVLSDNRIVDWISTNFGIRKVEVDATRGLRINGEPLKLRGGCLHHDNGVFGSVAIDRAEERRIELMKANGFNAIRCSHNPPSSAFLDACDPLGMLAIS